MLLDYPAQGALQAREDPLIISLVENPPLHVDLAIPVADREMATDPLGAEHNALRSDDCTDLPTTPPPTARLDSCVICFDKTEDSVLMCCSHGLCSDCERQWVRKRLRCPFCRQSFKSVKEAVQTQWQLGVAAIPVETVLKDVQSLEQKIQTFWRRLLAEKQDGSALGAILAENYVHRPKAIDESVAFEECDEFVVIQDLLATVS